ncbi:unnamed protein product [Closterium sp. Yama58-4]|nr:unnamed protein product [Closterium sp. Yama58-4]
MGETDREERHVAWRRLVEQAMEGGELDIEKFLEKMRRRLDSVGAYFPGVKVRFEGVSASAKVRVGARGLPTLPNQLSNSVGAVLRELQLLKDQRRLFFALDGCSGILKPGRMTLLLGPPGSGKSTLLRILAGKAERELSVQGEVTYNGRRGSQFVLPRSVAFVPQTDTHIGEMTVRETLEFSARLQGPGHRADLFRQVEEKEQEAGVHPDDVMQTVMKAMADERQCSDVVVQYVLKMLGLDVCADTMLGDSMRRGVSGGQKKRVTTAEALLGAKQVLLLDEISTGLDSATTYQITRCLRNLTHLTNTTTLISLLQPAPETFELFDDVMLMSEGRIVYHGPREEVLGFFQEMGFAPPARKGVADFLQEPHPYRYVSVRAFEEAFRASRFGKQMEAELSIPFKKDQGAVNGEKKGKGEREDGSADLALAQRRFGLPPLAILTVVGDREWLLMKRNLFLYIVQTMQILPLAIVTMSVFWRSQFSITPVDSNYYLGAIFFGISTMLFSGIIELTLLTARLPIYFLQRDSLLFPAWAWCVPMALLSLPVSLWSAGVWTAITYYGIGFAPEFSRFIAQLLLFFITHMSASALYRAMGAIFRSTTLINTLGNFILVLLFLLSGFLITKDDIHDVWVWVYWISPLTYSQNAFAINEFLAPRWDVSPASDLAASTRRPGSITSRHQPGLRLALLLPASLDALPHWFHCHCPLPQLDFLPNPSPALSPLSFFSSPPSSPAPIPPSSPPPSVAQGPASDLPASTRRPRSIVSWHQSGLRLALLLPARPHALPHRLYCHGPLPCQQPLSLPQEPVPPAFPFCPLARNFFFGQAGAPVPSGAGAGAASGAAGNVGESTGVSAVSSTGGRGKKQQQRKAVSYMSDGGAVSAVSSTGGEEKQRQRKAVSFLSDGDASHSGGVVSAVSSPAGGEKQRQRKAVSFMSDGDASDGGVVTAGSSTGGGEAGGGEKQRQRKAISYMSDGGVVSAVSSPGGEVGRGEEKQRQRTAVSFMSDGDASEGAAFEPTQRQRKAVSYMSDGDASDGAGVMTASGADIGQHGMVLPFDPLTLSFHNVNYYVDMPAELKDKNGPPGQRLQLLRNVSGVFRPGVLTALMGVSGAGKTTLMDVLAGRKTGGYIEGDIRVSGYPKVQETFLRVSGYCEQVDIHTPQVNVHESLLYSAWLRLPEEIDRDVILEFVEEVEELVELDAVKGALVGTAGQDGLSVEQRKRLTIAVELVANPSIIFMDEPTSGLDARAAAIVMRAVRNTVNTGRTVVCTIHQPSIDIFESAIESLIQESSEPPEGEPDLFFPTQHPTTPLSQFATHLWKRHLMYWRMPDYNGTRFFFSFIMALLIGGVFFGFGHTRDTPQQIVNVMGALYTAALFLGWSNLASIQPMMAVERSIFYRERGAGMYGAIPYALAQGAIELPYLVIQAVVYSLITYSMIQFEWTLVKFLMYLLFQFLTLLYFTCFGMMTSAITPAEGLGTLLSAFIYSFWNLLCGFLLPQPVRAVLVALCSLVLGDVTTLVESSPGMPAQTVSQFIQLYYGFSHAWLGYATVALLGFSLLFFCVFTIALRNLNFQRR